MDGGAEEVCPRRQWLCIAIRLLRFRAKTVGIKFDFFTVRHQLRYWHSCSWYTYGISHILFAVRLPKVTLVNNSSRMLWG